jgi:hypothetical protein
MLICTLKFEAESLGYQAGVGVVFRSGPEFHSRDVSLKRSWYRRFSVYDDIGIYESSPIGVVITPFGECHVDSPECCDVSLYHHEP